MEASVLPMGFSFTCKEQVAMAMIGGCRRNVIVVVVVKRRRERSTEIFSADQASCPL
jgi:hypothetical protein